MNITWPSMSPLITQGLTEKQQSPASEGIASFGEILKNAIGEVDELEKQSGIAKVQLATGEIDDIHKVMIASEKASLALQLTIQVQNKIMDAYREIMRMQI